MGVRPNIGGVEIWPWLPDEIGHGRLNDFICAIPHFVLTGLGLSGSWAPLPLTATLEEALSFWFVLRGVGKPIEKPPGLTNLAKRLQALQKAARKLQEESARDNRGNVTDLEANIGADLQALNMNPDCRLVYWAIWGSVLLAPVSIAAGKQEFAFVADPTLRPMCDLPGPYVDEPSRIAWGNALIKQPARLRAALDAALAATKAVESQLRRFGSPWTKRITNARQANLALLAWGEARQMGPYAVGRAIYDFVNGPSLHWVERDLSRQWLGINALNTPADAVNHILETWLDITALTTQGLVKKRPA